VKDVDLSKAAIGWASSTSYIKYLNKEGKPIIDKDTKLICAGFVGVRKKTDTIVNN
jgi:hypothetical protein